MGGGIPSEWGGRRLGGGGGFQAWVTVGRKGSRSYLFALWDGSRSGDLDCAGSSGVTRSHIAFAAVGAVLRGRTGEGGNKKRDSLMMVTPQDC